MKQCLLVKANPDFTDATIVKKNKNSEIANSDEGFFLEFKINGTSENSIILYCNKKNEFYINWERNSCPIDTSQLKGFQSKLMAEMMKIVTKSRNPERTWNDKTMIALTQFPDAVALKKGDKWSLHFGIPEKVRGITPILFSKARHEFYINWKNMRYALDVTGLREEKVEEMKKDVPEKEEISTQSAVKIILKTFMNPNIDWISPPKYQGYADEKLRNICLLWFRDDNYEPGAVNIYTLPHDPTLHYINYHGKRYKVDMSRIGEAEREKIIDRVHVYNEHEPDQNNFPFAGYVIQALEPKKLKPSRHFRG